MTDTIAQILQQQLDATWAMARELIAACPDEQWRVGTESYFVPARQLYHMLDCAQILVGHPPRPAPTPKPFGPHWNGPAGGLPSQEQLLEMLSRVEPNAAAWLASLSDQQFLSTAHPSLAGGSSPLAHVIYTIRHNQYHLAVVNGEYRKRNLTRMTWR